MASVPRRSQASRRDPAPRRHLLPRLVEGPRCSGRAWVASSLRRRSAKVTFGALLIDERTDVPGSSHRPVAPHVDQRIGPYGRRAAPPDQARGGRRQAWLNDRR
jgi:hypothetical protein